MSTEVPGNISSVSVISVGSNLSGQIDFNGDTDWYRVQLLVGFGYQIWLEGASSSQGTLIDPYLMVRDNNGVPLAFSNNINQYNFNSFINFIPQASSNYFLSAEESGHNAIGTYKITILIDQLASISTNAFLATNRLVTGQIGWMGDTSDWYAVTLSAGVQYLFDLVPSSSNSGNLGLADPFIFLRNASGLSILADDDSGYGLGSRIIYTPTVSGTFYLDVQESGTDDYGIYSLIVNEEPLSRPLSLDSNQQDSIVFQGDIDLFPISLTADIKYGVMVSGGSLIDPFLEILGAGGVVIATDDDSGPSLDSQTVFVPAASGIYFLGVRAANYTSLGNYSIRAWELPTISIGDASVKEGNTGTTAINFPITLSKASPVDVSFTIGTRAGTAGTASGDYQGNEITLTIPAGQTSLFFSILVNGDTNFEPSEGFSVVISAPVMATIADGNARGWIDDDDAPYTLPTDPLSRYQWHLYPDVGANVFPVWHSWSGAGIKVAVFDQGIDSNHPDLNDNIIIGAGRRASNLSVGGDPIRSSDNHGTAVTGVIAAEANGVGVIGVAPKVSLISIYSTLSASPTAFSTEVVNAFKYAQNFDVLNNSWGFGNSSLLGTDYPWAFMDNFRTAFFSAGQALKDLAEIGRNGLGTVVVQSAGNSYSLGDDTNLHNFQNSRYIITVAGTDYQGTLTSYSSPGASVLISAPGGQQNANNDALSEVLTTDRVGALGYSTSDHTFVSGTSFSGPIVSGVVALMLDANPALGYRDVQQILAYSARKIATSENQWEYNGASNWNGGGLHFDSLTHNLGFGMVDALAAVRLAESWSSIPLTSSNDLEHAITQTSRQAIPDGSSRLSQSINVNQVMEVERVEVTIDISHTYIGDLSILLTSPVGTTSFLMWRPGSTINSPFGQSQNNINFTFNTVLSWGENSVGTWRLSIFDQAIGDVGTLNSWTLNLIGKPVLDDTVYVYTNEFSESVADQALRSTLTDSVGIDQINASSVTTNSLINLQSRSQSNIDGRVLTIGPDTIIENAVSGDGNDTIYGNQFSNFLQGMRGNDSLFGFDGDDKLQGGWGNDIIDGGLGFDYAIFSGLRSNYLIERVGLNYRLTDTTKNDGDDGIDLLFNIEAIQFRDEVFQLGSLETSRKLLVLDTSLSPTYSGDASEYTLRFDPVTKALLVSESNPQSSEVRKFTMAKRIEFNDLNLNLEVNKVASTIPESALNRIAELYVAFFNRVPDGDGMHYWIGQYNEGKSISDIAEAFYSAGVFYSEITGYRSDMTRFEFISVIYKNVLGRDEVDSAGMAYWDAALASGAETKATLVNTILNAAHSIEFSDRNNPYHWVQKLLDYKLDIAKMISIEWGVNYNTAQDSISKGMAIAAAVTSEGIDEAIGLVGVHIEYLPV